MNYRVRYTRRALDQLADIWMSAPDRNAVTAASQRIDQLLATDPFNSESRPNRRRIIMVSPLSAQFSVFEAINTVTVSWIQSRHKRPRHP